jgi:hypothetical protein
MRNIILAALFLVYCAQDITTQPRNRNRQSQAQQSTSQPSPTPVDNRQAEIDNAAKAERERYEKAREAKEDSFREEQARQNRIISGASFWMAVFAGINLFVAVVYAGFAWLTLRAVKRQADHASEQVGVTRGQLTAMDRERRVLHTHAGAMFQTARFTKQMLNETHNLVIQNADAVAAMQGQLDAMKEQTRLIARQVELSVISERAYLLLRKWMTPRFQNGFLILEARLINGGRTPAWDVCGHTRIGVERQPRPPFPAALSDEQEGSMLNAEKSFAIAADEDALLPFTPLEVTDAQIKLLEEGQMHIFVDGVSRYFDSLGDKHFYTYGFTLRLGDAGVTPRYERHYHVKMDNQYEP